MTSPHISVIQTSHNLYLSQEPPVQPQQTSVIAANPRPGFLPGRPGPGRAESELVSLLQATPAKPSTASRQAGAKHSLARSQQEGPEDLSSPRAGKHPRILSIPPPPPSGQPQPSFNPLEPPDCLSTESGQASSAEHKRKNSIKSGFDFLRTQIPCLAQTPNVKISKAALLARGAEHVEQLSRENQSLAGEVETLRKSVQALNAEIANFQSQLPTAGSAVGRGPREDSPLQRLFERHVAACTMQNWKYFVFSRLVHPLLESFERLVYKIMPLFPFITKLRVTLPSGLLAAAVSPTSPGPAAAGWTNTSPWSSSGLTSSGLSR